MGPPAGPRRQRPDGGDGSLSVKTTATAPPGLAALGATAAGGLQGLAARAETAGRSPAAGTGPADSPFSRLLDRSRALSAAQDLPRPALRPPDAPSAAPSARGEDGPKPETDRPRDASGRGLLDRALEARQGQRQADEARARDQAQKDRQTQTADADTRAVDARAADGRAAEAAAARRATAANAARSASTGRGDGRAAAPAGPRTQEQGTTTGLDAAVEAVDAAHTGRKAGADPQDPDAGRPGASAELGVGSGPVPGAAGPAAPASAPAAAAAGLGGAGEADTRADRLAGAGGPPGLAAPLDTAIASPIGTASPPAVDPALAGTGSAQATGPATASAGLDPSSPPGAAPGLAPEPGTVGSAGIGLPPGTPRNVPSAHAASALSGDGSRSAAPTAAAMAATGLSGAATGAVEGAGGRATPSPGERFDAFLTAASASVPGAPPGSAFAAPPTAGGFGLSNEAGAPAPVVQAQVADALDSPGFAPSLAHQVSVLTRDGIERAEIRLNPVDMGPVSVQIQLDGSVARVEFTAEQAPTRSALEASLPQLAAALREAGFTLGGGGVFQQGGRSPGQAGASGERQGERAGRPGRGEEDRLRALNPSNGARRVAQGSIDLYA